MDDQTVRTAVAVTAIVFWFAFLGMTIYVTAKDGLTVLTGTSGLILVMTGIPLWSALRGGQLR